MDNEDLGNELNFWQDIPDDILGELENGLSERENPFGSTNTIFDDVPVGTTNWLTASQDKLRQSSDVLSNAVKPPPLAASNSNLMLSQTLQRELSNMNKPVTIKTEPGTTVTNAPLETIFQDARPFLQGLFTTSSRFDSILRDSTDKQRKLTTSQTDEFSKLVGTLFSLQQEINKAIKDTVDILRSYVLRPSELSDALVLKQSFQFQNQRADLYSTELANLAKEDDKCIAALAITEQPFSQVVFKARPIDGHYSVDILTGIRTQLEKASLVSAFLTDEEAFKSPKPIENDKAELSTPKHRAKFEDLKINVSTRMTSVALKFTCHVKEKGKTPVVQITSPTSYPMIVITNESQWGEAAGKLLQAEVFPTGINDIPWPYFINYVHINLLNATQQDFKAAQRPFCDWEIKFLHSKFFASSMKITREMVEVFWKWFGQVLTTIRFKRHVRSLWFTGIVYGLVNKKDCTRILQNEEVGTFLIRFSDSSPGSFAIAYVADDPTDRVKHYLIKPEDIGSNKSLPDFLKERHHFINLVKLDPSNGNLSKCNKEIVFKAYSSTKRQKQPAPDKHGYVQHVS